MIAPVMLTGLAQINLELTANCTKRTKCFMCGHTPFHEAGSNMSLDLLASIIHQLPFGIIASLHRNGDPLDYPSLSEALKLLSPFIVSIVTHGERLGEKADQIIDNCVSVTVSVIPSDPDREIQLASVRAFISAKGSRAPMLQLKFVGRIEDPEPYEALGVPIIGRALHSKRGDWNYVRADPVVPEVRVCLDFLGRPTVDWQGRVFQCNRLDVGDEGLIGDLREQTLDEIWNGPKRAAMLKAHLAGRRDLANELCKKCTFWGVPTASG